MSFFTRLVLSAPFVLILVQYVSYAYSVVGHAEVDSFWQNHALRESLFAAAVAAVSLNLIWSTKVTQGKLVLVAALGAPLILGFWIATLIVGFGDVTAYRPTYIFHLAQLVLFIIGFLMVATR